MSQTQQSTKGQADSDKPLDPFLLDTIYKDPIAAFLHKPLTVEELKKDCLIFLDTNVLLIPYSTSKNSLKSFTDIYKNLSDEGRLYLADRVMQEFEKNVPEKLKEIFHNLVQGQNYNAQSIDFPLLDGMEEYIKLKAAEKTLRDNFEQYRKATRETLSAIERWDHNDPVRTVYRSVFANAKRAQISTIQRDQILKNWNYRLDNKIPPGYKDGGKADSGIGDYLFWQAVLDTCSTQQKDAIIVSSDAKPDWWHKTVNQSLYARRELVEEFRAATGGKTVRLLSPADFLKLYGANVDIVEEVALEQAIVTAQTKVKSLFNMQMRFEHIIAIKKWLKSRTEAPILQGGPNTVVFSSNSVTHEFRCANFTNARTGLNILQNYAQESPAATYHTMVLASSNKSEIAKLVDALGEGHAGSVNVIVGISDSSNFIPVYWSNKNQIDDVFLGGV